MLSLAAAGDVVARLGAMARTSSRMAHEPVKLEDRGLRQWQKDARVDAPLAGVVVDLLANILLLL